MAQAAISQKKRKEGLVFNVKPYHQTVLGKTFFGDCSQETILLERNSLRTFLSSLETGLSIKPNASFATLVNFSNYENHPIHRWFKYREGYSIKLVKQFLQRDETLVLDPFCGSGTTLLAAKEEGLSSIGFDINPVSTFISEVKTADYSEEDIITLRKLIGKILNMSVENKLDKPELSIIDKVFNEEILNVLLCLKEAINEVKEKKHHDFLKLGWLSILEEVSNARKEGNGIKYRFTKRTPNGYVTLPQKEWEEKAFGKHKKNFVFDALKEKYSEMLYDIEHSRFKTTKTLIYQESALAIDKHIKKGTISTVIFSPPYANSFDYFEIFKVELWMGDFVKNYEELKNLRRKALRSNVNSELNSSGTIKFAELDLLLSFLKEDKLWDDNIKKVLYGYFTDMKIVLEKAFECLKPNGECVIVVGNSAYGGVIIPTDALLAHIAKKIGFEGVEINVARHLTTSSQQKVELTTLKEHLRESVIVMRKPSKESTYTKVVELPQFSIPKGKKFIITSNNVSYLTHVIHKYPAKFIPQIPRWAISKYASSGKCIVLDPFCGSGTTLVEGILLGNKSYGIDIDPLARLISKVKTTHLEKERLDTAIQDVINRLGIKKTAEFKPSIPNLSHWFSNDAIKKLGIIRDVIEENKSDKDIYDFLIVAYSSIIRRASNADNQSQKTYVSHTNIKEPEDAFDLFKRKLEQYSVRLQQLFEYLPQGAKAHILEKSSDARNFSSHWIKTGCPKVDIAITSPPYLKAVDYVYTHMAEYFWIGDLFGLQTMKQQNNSEQQYMGTKRVPVADYSTRLETNYDSINLLTELVYKKNKKFAYVLAKFFIDMEMNIREVRKVLKDGGHYIIVIGNNKVAGVPINSNKIISEIGIRNGFELENMFAYKIRNRYMRFPRKGRGGLITEDWIIDLRKA